MFFLTKKKNPHETGCLACHIVVASLLFLAVIAACFGILMAHYDVAHDMLIFGTASGSLSIIAFVISLTLWMHAMKSCTSGCEACTTKKK